MDDALNTTPPARTAAGAPNADERRTHLPTPDDVLAARTRLAPFIESTQTRAAPRLAAHTGAQAIWMKLDTELPTGAFKERGALNALLGLSPEQAARGVITASAGNHAQALAHHAKQRGLTASVVMPATTPKVKIAGARRLGAEVVIHGQHLAEAMAEAHRLADVEGRAFIAPFDDPDIVAGQGVGVLEFLEDAPDLDTLFIPIGGGGLIGGALLAAEAFSAETGRPAPRVVGVEPAMYPCMHAALSPSAPPPPGGPSIAEGAAVLEAGALATEICRTRLPLEDLLMVSEAAIEEAIVSLAMVEKQIAEGAGAMGLAALLEHPDRGRDRVVGLHVCGGNIDARLLAQVLSRHLIRSRRRAYIRVECYDMPGSLARVCRILNEEDVNIIDVLHNRMAVDVPAKETRIDLLIETDDSSVTDTALQRLRQAGFRGARLMQDGA